MSPSTTIGVLQVAVRSARDIEGSKIGGGTPDPYASFTLNERATAPLEWRPNSCSSRSLQESIVLRVMDFSDHRADTHLGSASFGLDVLECDATQEEISRRVLKGWSRAWSTPIRCRLLSRYLSFQDLRRDVQKLPETGRFRHVSYWGIPDPLS